MVKGGGEVCSRRRSLRSLLWQAVHRLACVIDQLQRVRIHARRFQIHRQQVVRASMARLAAPESKMRTSRSGPLAAGVLRIDSSKNGEARTFPFRALPALEALFRRQRERVESIQAARVKLITRVLTWDAGRPILDFRHSWDAAFETAGLQRAHPARLRADRSAKPVEGRRSRARHREFVRLENAQCVRPLPHRQRGRPCRRARQACEGEREPGAGRAEGGRDEKGHKTGTIARFASRQPAGATPASC